MMADTRERISPKSTAHQNPVTKNPGTIYAVSITSAAFITSVKRPIERKLIGKVSNINMGFRIALAKPRTIAAVKAAMRLSTDTPGRR